jgi:pSer/pThr/pTyr-binding forkhead associated (FHA) protein
LENQEIFTFGSGQDCDVPLEHDSISKLHAAFVLTKDEGVKMLDFGSEYGTMHNGKKLEANFPVQVAFEGDSITFGASLRQYDVKIDYTRMQKAAEDHLRALELEMEQLD